MLSNQSQRDFYLGRLQEDLLVNVNHATMFSGPDAHLRDTCSKNLLIYIIKIPSCSLKAFSENACESSRL